MQKLLRLGRRPLDDWEVCMRDLPIALLSFEKERFIQSTGALKENSLPIHPELQDRKTRGSSLSQNILLHIILLLASLETLKYFRSSIITINSSSYMSMSSYQDIFYSMDEEADSNSSHVSQAVDIARNENYVFRAPSPPHINMPRPREQYSIQLSSLSEMWCGNEQFLKFIRESLDGSNYSLPNQEWRYEQRREAQQILPYLYLGPSAAARDIGFLQQEDITMLLVVRDSAMARANLFDGAKVASQLGIESEAIDIHSVIDLIPAFPHAVRLINDHVSSIFRLSNSSKIGKVLVFCETGNDRSAVVVSAYLMATCGLDLASAAHRIQSRRFCVSFDDRMKNLLLSYMSIINATNDVSRIEPRSFIPPSLHTSGNKRERNEDPDEEGNVDKERFVGRANLGPFR